MFSQKLYSEILHAIQQTQICFSLWHTSTIQFLSYFSEILILFIFRILYTCHSWEWVTGSMVHESWVTKHTPMIHQFPAMTHHILT